MVNITRSQAEWLVFALRQLIGLSRLTASVRLRPEIPALLQHLDDLLVASPSGTENQWAERELTIEDAIDTKTAAEILDRSPRWVRYIKDDLDAQKVGGRLVFERQTVLDYANERRCA